MKQLSDLKTMLADAGIKPSHQRLAVVRFLADNLIHPTVDDIYTGLLPEYPTMSRTTVYNTVRLLEKAHKARSPHPRRRIDTLRLQHLSPQPLLLHRLQPRDRPASSRPAPRSGWIQSQGRPPLLQRNMPGMRSKSIIKN